MSRHVTAAGAYAAVFAALLGLTAATVVLAFQDLGRWNQPVALAIAAAKALLVAAYFMHLRGSPPLTRLFAAAGLLWLLLLIGLSYADFRARKRVAKSDSICYCGAEGRKFGLLGSETSARLHFRTSARTRGRPRAGFKMAADAFRHRPRGE